MIHLGTKRQILCTRACNSADRMEKRTSVFACWILLKEVAAGSYRIFLWKTFSNVTQVLPSAIFPTIWYKKETRYLIEITGFYLVAGARFELTTFRL